MSENSWSLQFVLPNLKLAEPIVGSHVALLPSADARLDKGRTGASGILLSRFETPFGDKIQPTALVTRERPDKSKHDLESLAAFRNAVALAVLTSEWNHAHASNGQLKTLYADAFDLYPVTPTYSNDKLVFKSPMVFGIDFPDNFRGQCSPAVVSPHIRPLRYRDELLLPVLFREWEQRFILGKITWNNTRLFRSLALAFHAAHAPMENLGSLYDFGTRAALWVSAFEVLTRPGRKGKANLKTVLDLLSACPWNAKALRKRKFRVRYAGKNLGVTFAQKLYARLYQARNDFAHGNRVDQDSLLSDKHTPPLPLHSIAPLLYRLALVTYLKLTGKNHRSVKRYVDDRFAQRSCEEGLVSILKATK